MSIWNFLVGIFNAAKKAFLNLTEEQQKAILTGSGIIDFINDRLEKSPSEIREGLLLAYPQLDVAVLEKALFELADLFNIGSGAYHSLDDVIDLIQAKLKSVNGAKWATISHALASGLSILLAPPETKLKQIVMTLEWVYQKFFKKSVD